MKIALIYDKDCEFTTGATIEEIIKNAGISFEHFWTKEAHNIPRGFGLYFRVDHGDYKYDLPPELRPAVFYVVDTHLKKPYKKIRSQVSHYDIVFCAQKSGAHSLHRQTGVDTQWVPLACDTRFNKKQDIPKKYDIGFVGRDAEKFPRGRHLRLLRRKYPNSFIGTAPFLKVSEIYSASKIGFNSSIRNDINMRIFEVMSCGCFLLTNYIKDNGLGELFRDKEHLVTYRDDREMIELADYYLRKDKEREKIALTGYKLVTGRHTFYNRVQQMLNYIAFKFGGEFNELRI